MLIYNIHMINELKKTTYTLLKKSESWTKTDMIYLAKGGGWLTLGKFVGSLSGFFLAIVYANFLPKEEYATYKYLLSIAALFSIITLPGIETSLIRSIAKGYEGSYNTGLIKRLKWSIIGGLIAATLAGYYFFKGNHILSIGLVIIAITSPIINCFSMVSLLQGKKLWKTSSILNIIKTLILFILITLSTYYFPKALPLLLTSYLTTAVIQLIYFKYLIKKYPLNNNIDTECLKLGKHLSLMSALGTISEHIDKIIIWKFLGANELAIYSFAQIPINQLKDFLRSISILAFPKIAQQKSSVTKKTLLPKIFKLTIILLIPTFIYFISAPFLFRIFFPQYLNSVFYSQILAFTWLLFPLRMLSQTLISETKTKFLYIIQVLDPLVKITMYIILIPALGISGAIFSIYFSGLFSLALLIHFFKKI